MKRPALAAYRGGWALVTGSARDIGLGYAFARQLATEGMNLVLVDILADDLASRADELRADFGIEVRTAACDLGEPAPYQAIEELVGDIDVDVLVCNHMFTPSDSPKILDTPLETQSRMLDINARGYSNLVHRFGTEMRDRGSGAIVIVSSGVGLTSGPYNGVYAANKAFQLVLGETLWYELQGTGVDVLVMVGGLMNTQGDAFARFPRAMIAEPADVANEVLAAVGRKHMIVPGVLNRAFLLLQTRLMSRRRAVTAIGKFLEKGLDKPGR
ncbi:MAG TPA: SDR family NAD(P)-dependent oxidoreductase [Mycobacterium sp.]|nr:SDR family NAD(P)-dependent oxidoreductase [Mycobacterium sp.]